MTGSLNTASGPLRILLATLGSRGDVEPFIHLARAARAGGHDVRLAAPEQDDLPTGGLDVVSLGVRFSDLNQDRSTSLHAFREQIRPAMSHALRAVVDAGLDFAPDVIVAHPKALTAPVLAEHLGVPFLVAELTPTVTPTAQFPAAGLASKSLGAPLNRLSYRVVGLAALMFRSDVKAARDRLGIAAGRLPDPAATLVAVSPTLLERPEDWPPSAHITGDWHSPATSTPVDSELDAFIRGDAPFVYAGFGSMSDGDPTARAEAIIEGARGAGLRVLMATGWGGLRPPSHSLGSDVFVTATVPHDAVLPRAVAAIHHGGAGTTHAVARAGTPSVVVPFLADQPFWAARLHSLGVAAEPLHRNRMIPERVRSAITAAVTRAGKARDVAHEMSSENGAARAVELIEELTKK